MRRIQSIDAKTGLTFASRWRARLRSGLVLMGATTMVAACAGSGSGSPAAPTGSGRSGDPSAAASQPSAGGYPDRTITFVVPFAAGGPTDTVTRLVAEPMSKTLGQQIVVQNVAGAGGTLAAGQVAAAAPDGYTVLMHHIGMSTAPALYKELPYKPLDDFKTIGLVTDVPMTIIARKDLPPNDLKKSSTPMRGSARPRISVACSSRAPSTPRSPRCLTRGPARR
jgi:hypothetical protein